MSVDHHEVLIIGSGFAGLGTAIALKRAGFTDVRLVDDADGVGGTWHWNTYPGVAVDIPSFSYQFSYAQRSDWTRSYAKGAELKGYADWLADTFDLRPHIRFGTRVTDVTWDDDARRWHVETSRGPLTATYVVHAGGPLSQPKYPDITGLETFGGPTVHTARWDHALDLRGQRVAIIGTGASSVQVVPEIAPIVERLTVFQRTAIWCLPKPDFPLAKITQAGLRHLPGVRRAARLASNAFVEVNFPLIGHYDGVLKVTKVAMPAAKGWLRSQVKDPVTRERLTPRYDLGCKRPSFHNGYLATFNRDNVDLVTDAIREIRPNGVVTADGILHHADVLILATGFKVTERDALPTYELTGRDGKSLGDWWESERLQAYQGVSCPGFPNFFTTFGPYGYNGSSYFQLVEAVATHLVRVMKEARRRGASEVEVTQDALDDYVATARRRQSTSVFYNAHCSESNSYYFNKDGDVALRPGLTPEVRWRNAHFPLDHYSYA